MSQHLLFDFGIAQYTFSLAAFLRVLHTFGGAELFAGTLHAVKVEANQCQSYKQIMQTYLKNPNHE